MVVEARCFNKDRTWVYRDRNDYGKTFSDLNGKHWLGQPCEPVLALLVLRSPTVLDGGGRGSGDCVQHQINV